MPRQGKRRVKRRTHLKQNSDGTTNVAEEGESDNTPKVMVICHGDVPNVIRDLDIDIRQMMAPNAAKKLVARKRNKLKDFVAVSGLYGVSHLIRLTATDKGVNLGLARLSQGPTLSFKLNEYCLMKDVRATQDRPRGDINDFHTAPLLVLNGFGGKKTVAKDLVSLQLKAMFPSIDMADTSIKSCRRIVLAHWEEDGEGGQVVLRHFHISVKEHTALSKPIKKLLSMQTRRGSRLPDLGSVYDIADALGVNEAEETDHEDEAGPKAGVSLTEIGPRLTMQLVKAEAGLMEGEVLYHAFVEKSVEEIDQLQREAASRKALREKKAKEAEEQRQKREEAKANKEAKDKAALKRKVETAMGAEGSDDEGANVKEAKEHVGTVDFNEVKDAKTERSKDAKGGKGGKGKGNGKGKGKGKGKKEAVMERFKKARTQ